MLAVWGKQRELAGGSSSPLSPCGVKRRHEEHVSLTPEEEMYVSGVLDQLYDSLPRRQHAYVNEHFFGGGANGLAWVESMTQGLASDGDVSVFFKGTLENNPAEVEDAQYILQEYRKGLRLDTSGSNNNGGGGGGAFGGSGGGDGGELAAANGSLPVLEVLSQLHGPYAFVLYHRTRGRIVAARDPAGAEPLYWGTTLLSEGVLFASDKALIEGECSDADPFPAGMVWVSEDFSTVGSLVPINVPDGADVSPAVQQELLCRVESSSQLHKVASQGHIEAS